MSPRMRAFNLRYQKPKRKLPWHLQFFHLTLELFKEDTRLVKNIIDVKASKYYGVGVGSRLAAVFAGAKRVF